MLGACLRHGQQRDHYLREPFPVHVYCTHCDTAHCTVHTVYIVYTTSVPPYTLCSTQDMHNMYILYTKPFPQKYISVCTFYNYSLFYYKHKILRYNCCFICAKMPILNIDKNFKVNKI